jgi:hypothetical protein
MQSFRVLFIVTLLALFLSSCAHNLGSPTSNHISNIFTYEQLIQTLEVIPEYPY